MNPTRNLVSATVGVGLVILVGYAARLYLGDTAPIVLMVLFLCLLAFGTLVAAVRHTRGLGTPPRPIRLDRPDDAPRNTATTAAPGHDTGSTR